MSSRVVGNPPIVSLTKMMNSLKFGLKLQPPFITAGKVVKNPAVVGKSFITKEEM